MFSNIDFLSGKVKWANNCLEEDMLQVVYPNNYILDVGWYSGINKCVIYIIRDYEWGVPVVKYSAEDENNIKILLQEAINKVEYESNTNTPYYGGLWKTEIIDL